MGVMSTTTRHDRTGKWSGFLDTPTGKAVAAVIVLIAAIAVYLLVRPRDVAADLSRKRVFICSETNKSFALTVEEGMMVPVKSPYSGKNTGYPAEMCWWTKDGQHISAG